MKATPGESAVDSLGLAGQVARAFINSKLTPLVVIENTAGLADGQPVEVK